MATRLRRDSRLSPLHRLPFAVDNEYGIVWSRQTGHARLHLPIVSRQIHGGRSLSTAIQLTSRDAVDGVTLPLTVAVRSTCRRCGGRGESWTECCLTCNGSGAELLRCELQVTVPAGVTDGTRVRFTLMPPQSPPTRVELRIAVD